MFYLRKSKNHLITTGAISLSSFKFSNLLLSFRLLLFALWFRIKWCFMTGPWATSSITRLYENQGGRVSVKSTDKHTKTQPKKALRTSTSFFVREKHCAEIIQCKLTDCALLRISTRIFIFPITHQGLLLLSDFLESISMEPWWWCPSLKLSSLVLWFNCIRAQSTLSG